ncbi:MAG: MetQ/NlpA family ABC transporter substrate-binding protein, partial [Lactobacillus iners]|nr:MetQ/NlpA family ABC transporter substrate-binding protein [Lactobacillus iners]
YTEPVNKDSKQWINIICSTRKNKNNPLFKKIIKVYQTNKVKQLYKKYYGNTQIPAWDIKL